MTQLFTSFFPARRRTAEQPAGAGLGLVITRLLVELDGGQLMVSSTAGQASIFSSSLPATAAMPEAAQPEGASGPKPIPGGTA